MFEARELSHNQGRCQGETGDPGECCHALLKTNNEQLSDL